MPTIMVQSDDSEAEELGSGDDAALETVIRLTINVIDTSAGQQPSVYFLKHSCKSLTKRTAEAGDELAHYIEYGSLSSNTLKTLDKLISQLYLPILGLAQDLSEAAGNAFADVAQPGNVLELSHAMGEDFMASLHKFSDHLKGTVQHVEGHIRLVMLSNLKQLVAKCRAASGPDAQALQLLTEQVELWTTTIGNLLQETSQMTRAGPGPQAELNHWTAYCTTLTALTEQLNSTVVHNVVAVLRNNSVPELEGYDFNLAQVNKQRAEAKDNVRFLSTLERHFKHLSQCTTFSQATEHMGALMNALRMVWVISRHFNTDERMVALMERIAWLLCHRVRRQITPRTLLKKPLLEAMTLCEEGVAMLEAWESAYLSTRETIEQHGRDARWEFDRQRLFSKTTYMVKVLQNLKDIARITQEFYNIFGSELKRVTGNPQVRAAVLSPLPLEASSAPAWLFSCMHACMHVYHHCLLCFPGD